MEDIMKFKTLMSIKAIICLLFGIGFILIPMTITAYYGMAPGIHGRLMTVDPGEYFYLNIIWDLYLDNSIWVVDLLNFETSNSSGQFIFSKPETFYIEAEISLFNETGVFSYDATPISLVAWKKGEVETKDPDPGS